VEGRLWVWLRGVTPTPGARPRPGRSLHTSERLGTLRGPGLPATLGELRASVGPGEGPTVALGLPRASEAARQTWGGVGSARPVSSSSLSLTCAAAAEGACARCLSRATARGYLPARGPRVSDPPAVGGQALAFVSLPAAGFELGSGRASNLRPLPARRCYSVSVSTRKAQGAGCAPAPAGVSLRPNPRACATLERCLCLPSVR
jgi:hypothetical protein